jgi:3-phenylpropionate/trans-cinnamate dioxygenase ferredoxin reductase subunit
MSGRLVVVGASLAGVSLVSRLRELGDDRPVTVLGDEEHLPYDRPPLSKSVLEGGDPQLLKPLEWFGDMDVELRLGERATGIQVEPLAVEVGAERIEGSDIVIATGARVRELAQPVDLAGIHYLRTLTDAQRLRVSLQAGASVVVLGAGFIGLEVASAAVRAGCRVVVLERGAAPLIRVVGARIGELCTASLRSHGVDIRCSVEVDRLVGEDSVRGVVLTGGEEIEADVVIVGIGAQPNVEWLQGSAVTVLDGVVCDGVGRTSVPHIWAVGDAARWPNASTRRHRRVEQWQAARDHGGIVATALLGLGAEPWSDPPFFWSDVMQTKIQFVGHCDPDMPVHVAQADDRLVAVFGRDRLEGVLTLSAPRALALGRRLLVAGADIADARTWADGVLA